MFTYPGEFDELSHARLARFVSAEDFEKIEKARAEAFLDIFDFFSSFIRRIFKRKTA